MDLPPPQHSLQGPKPPHDFLSLYDSANPTNLEQRSEQENRLRLTTHDFLQPLERGAKKNEISSSQGVEVSSRVETSVTGAAVSSVDRILPGGMGTYSISHISSYSQTNGKTDIPVAHANGIESKPEATTAPFTLWDERLQAGDPARISDTLAASSKELLEKSGYWPSVRPKAELSFHGKTPFNFSTVETSHQSLAISTKARPATSQGLAEMMKSAKHASEDEDEDEEEYVERIRDKRKESSTQKVDNTLKAEGKANEQKANTPRSKHSATEQRRRSKINDRFQMLRGLVPHSDQKRDKASFLLEVIEYIQVLQEKVRKYEANEQAWNQEKKKAAVWDMCKRSPGRDVPTESSRIITGTLLDSKQSNELGDSLRTMRSSNAIHNNELPAVSTEKPSNSHLPCNRASPVISGYSSSYNEDSSCCFNKSIPPSFLMQQSAYHNFGRGFLHPTHPKGQALPLQQGSGCNGGTIQKESNAMQPVPKVEPQHPRTYFNPLVSQTETEAVSRQLHSVPCSLDQRTGEMYPGRGEQEELVIQGGVINISSVYSQGLLDTLTQALKSSGLDLSQANVSVQIDLGRRDGASAALANVKGGSQNIEDSLQNCQSQSPPKVSSTVSETEPPHKRPKTEKNP